MNNDRFVDCLKSRDKYLKNIQNMNKFNNIYSQPCSCGHLYSTVTCIKRSHFSWAAI